MATDPQPTAPRHPSDGAPATTSFQWIPIRSLAPRHRPRIVAQLLELPGMDRYLRFGHPASDAQIGRYVDLIDFDRDEVFGVFNRRLQLIAMAHLAYLGDSQRPHAAEFGVSVLPRYRGRGFGGRLFDHAMLHARNRHVDTLIVHALSENTPMLRIARSAGARVERDGGDAEAVLKLPPETLGTHVEELLGRQAAEFDYNLKRGAQRIDRLLDMIADVREGVGHSGGLGSQ
ncbi:MAG: GNAT family N-acetyltransferase [Rubrivivax sp.]|nr:GNAT family N-acetyltransferase [Rubrivivax sp.]